MENDSNTTRPQPIDSTKGADLAEQALREAHASGTGPDADRLGNDVHEVTIDVNAWIDDVKARIRRHPLTSAGIVAALAYVWGATR